MKIDKKIIIICLIIAIAVIAVIAIVSVGMSKGNKENNGVSSNTKSTSTAKANYNGKIVSKEEYENNRKKDEEIVSLANELIMTNDMIGYDLGYDGSSNTQSENISEEEKKDMQKMSSESYYQERDEILAKLRDLLK